MSTTVAAGILAALITQHGHLLEKYDVSQPPVEWYDGPAHSSGETVCGYMRDTNGIKTPFCRIKINECLVNQPEVLNETYLHELAHAVDWLTDEDWDEHSGQWKRVMRSWGLFRAGSRGKYEPSSEGC